MGQYPGELNITQKGDLPMKVDIDRIDRLVEYVQGLMNNGNGKELYVKYRSDLEQVTPQEAFEVFYQTLQKGKEPGEILLFLDKVINVFHKSLKEYSWEMPAENSFLYFLMKENRALSNRIDAIKELLKEKNLLDKRKELLPKVRELLEFNHHYLKKENIFFPFLETKMKKFDGLAIMWALHDETRTRLKRVIECLEAESCEEAELNAELGSLFFAMYGLIQKEELILFPAASEVINENEWLEMQRQSLEYEFPFVEKPDAEGAGRDTSDEMKVRAGELPEEGGQFKAETGVLSFEQILMIFDSLPMDLTFVDENNKVRFFTRPKDRIFPRSPAIIGRDVEKCHPPESVHVVREIIGSFRSGSKDSASFWINIGEKMVLIQYFALRNPIGEYRGTLEVSQDITGIKMLEGERRLLQWEK